MISKIFRKTLLVTVCVLLATVVIIMGVMYNYTAGTEQRQLKIELDLAASAVTCSGEAYLASLDSSQYRLTWVAADGTVLYDTQADAKGMENHADRDEIHQAITTGYGSSSRYSATLTEKTIYYAKRLSDGTVLRISESHASVLTLVLGMLQPIGVVTVLAIIASAILASHMARRIVAPLNELDLEHPLDNDTYEELAPLLQRINLQHQQISAQLRDLKQKTDEFSQITGNLNEALVLLDEKGFILSINPAAQKLFDTDASCVGKDFLTVDRSPEIQHATKSAYTDGHSEIRAERNEREYQFGISRIVSNGAVIGAVLLAFDVTEQAFAEQNRREFTANVSHELKTPLQSIIGSAELIENGLVQPEDMPRFICYIRKEASRLVTLIEDIIRLSQLDENTELPREPVDLFALAKDVAATLQNAADANHICISVTGSSTTMQGVHRLLYETIYNLCDNAIKYNVENGKVEISVFNSEKGATICVKDTGIGIAPAHQSRVFERFYRVDKSHSKASGGTGLGLSIVKHAVQFHHGSIDLQSTVGTGTAITIVFPQ